MALKDVRSEGQRTRKTSFDVGEVVGGSRKELAKMTHSQFKTWIEELEGIDETGNAADKVVTKKLVDFDFKSEYKNGVEYKCAVAKELILNKIDRHCSIDSPAARDIYLKQIIFIRDEWKSIQSYKIFKEWIKNFFQFDSRITFIQELEKLEAPKRQQEKNYGYPMDLIEEYYKDYPDFQSILENHVNGYSTDNFRKWIISNHEKFPETLKEIVERFYLGDCVFKTIILGEASLEEFLGVLVDGSINDKWPEEYKPKKRSRPRIPVGNGVEDGLKRVLPKEFIKTNQRGIVFKDPRSFGEFFGFRAVEFGNYVSDKEATHALFAFTESFCDIAELIGIPYKMIGLKEL